MEEKGEWRGERSEEERNKIKKVRGKGEGSGREETVKGKREAREERGKRME